MKMKKQVVIRTYPNNYTETNLQELQRRLNNGYLVVMCNRFSVNDRGQEGNEYILEKDEGDAE